MSMMRLIIMNLSRNYSLGYPRRAFQRCNETQSYLSERFMNISNLRKIYHGDFYIFVF